MLLRLYLIVGLSAVVVAGDASLQHVFQASTEPTSTNEERACQMLQCADSSNYVSFPPSAAYKDGIDHWSNASSAVATCVVEPASVEDIQTIFSVINETRALWAIKGLGNTNNPNHSATTGVQVFMSKWTSVSINKPKLEVMVGPTITWTQVHTELEGSGLMVVDTRVANVGTAGLLLTGGYSYLTNEAGFAMDNILSYDIVRYDGKFETVTPESNPDLFFALQGGVNNFGIVTSFTLRAFPMGYIWGGQISIPGGDITEAITAVSDASYTIKDPKATITNIFSSTAAGDVSLNVLLYYNGTQPPPGMFDKFIALPNASRNLTTFSYREFVANNTIASASNPAGRATWHSTPIKATQFSVELLTFITEQVMYYTKLIKTRSGTRVTGNVEPFLPSAYGFGNQEIGSAWPKNVSQAYNTLNGLVIWDDAEDDAWMFDITREYSDSIYAKAISLGLAEPNVLYPPGYATNGTDPGVIYGHNLPRLQKIQRSVDPWRLSSLTGGWKI